MTKIVVKMKNKIVIMIKIPVTVKDRSEGQERRAEDATQESFKGIPGPSGCQPAADGAAGRDIETDDQPDRARRLFTVGHTGTEDRKSMQCKGRRYFSV